MNTIGLCSDHAGFELKEFVKQLLEEQGLAYKDFGTYSAESCDYPDYAHSLARAVEAAITEAKAADRTVFFIIKRLPKKH